jgi:hypothetical protein
MVGFQKHWKQRLFNIIFHNGNTLFLTNKRKNQLGLNLGSNIRDNMLWSFFLKYFFKIEKKRSKTPCILFFMYM